MNHKNIIKSKKGSAFPLRFWYRFMRSAVSFHQQRQ
jgi:hypothetical protein